MFDLGMPFDFIGLLHAQQAYYISEFGQMHKALARQYRRLADLELAIAERHDNQLTRRDKKKLQWSRALTKKAIRDIQSQQNWLQDYLRKCNDVIASYGNNAYITPSSLTDHMPLMPYSLSPYPPSSLTPWSSTIHDLDHQTQYWDLSMLRERRLSSPSAPSADSGFHEPRTQIQYGDSVTPTTPSPRRYSCKSESDPMSILRSPASPTKSGADLPIARKRRYSENAIQLIENRLSALRGHTRMRSVEEFSAPERTLSERAVVGTGNVAGTSEY